MKALQAENKKKLFAQKSLGILIIFSETLSFLKNQSYLVYKENIILKKVVKVKYNYS